MSTTTVTYSNDDKRKFFSSTALTADTALTPANTGEVFYLDAIGEDITLPAVGVSAGVEFEFIVTDAVATTSWTVAATTASIYGSVIEAGLVQLASAETTISIVFTKAIAGDTFSLKCDGTKWYVKGFFSVAGSFTTV